jgi:hypothetical protein
MGVPLIRMDPYDYCRCRNPDDDYRFRRRHDVVFRMPSIFLMTAILSTASMARENAAGSREQGGNAC